MSFHVSVAGALTSPSGEVRVTSHERLRHPAGASEPFERRHCVDQIEPPPSMVSTMPLMFVSSNSSMRSVGVMFSGSTS